MGHRKLIAVLVAVPSLALAACGDGGGSDPTTTDDAGSEVTSTEAGEGVELDCRSVDVIVPYSPGGGSDQQVRRLQAAIEATLDTRLNITYQTGGDGSVGWNALANATPDGCTIANVVMPNIVNLSETAGSDVGFTAENFEYIAWTEYSPNMILVGQDSEFETIEQFIEAAEEEPGGVTLNGVGSTGELLANEMMQATGIEVSYVPVTGGVGDMIPQVAGGHVDAAITGSSGLEGGQLRPLALSASSDKFGDVPTFEEAGYEGVKLVTSWGLILPPETPQDIVEAWNAAIQTALEDPDVKAAYDEASFTVLDQDVDEARQYFEEQQEATLEALSAVG